ncbi:hypothetical protein MAM1_0453c10582 [Mucor ambiguus]|uniref:Uncharacterized protein n=1 Tax=Mucor ambiguus TaxID=91626 RepID=A0A0C9LYF4_9FUNG|nr:hypothetical protein MAM1_0453c10582 [Mucor ambiguus]
MFYLKVDSENIIRDCIEYPYDGYVQVDLPTPLPMGINAGYYRYQNGNVTLDEALKAEVDKQNNPPGYNELENRIDLMQKALDDVILGGAL